MRYYNYIVWHAKSRNFRANEIVFFLFLLSFQDSRHLNGVEDTASPITVQNKWYLAPCLAWYLENQRSVVWETIWEMICSQTKTRHLNSVQFFSQLRRTSEGELYCFCRLDTILEGGCDGPDQNLIQRHSHSKFSASCARELSYASLL